MTTAEQVMQIDGRTISNGLRYTARIIRDGKPATHNFADWFESGQPLADVISAGLYRKAQEDEALKANLFRYLSERAVMKSVATIEALTLA